MLLLFVLAALATGTMGAPDPNAIPKACQDTGLALQSACASEVQKATAYFGVTPDKAASVPQSKVDAYLSDPAAKPSAGCCAASSAFNSASCACNPKVMELAKSFTGGDLGTYNKVTSALAQACGYTKIC